MAAERKLDASDRKATMAEIGRDLPGTNEQLHSYLDWSNEIGRYLRELNRQLEYYRSEKDLLVESATTAWLTSIDLSNIVIPKFQQFKNQTEGLNENLLSHLHVAYRAMNQALEAISKTQTMEELDGEIGCYFAAAKRIFSESERVAEIVCSVLSARSHYSQLDNLDAGRKGNVMPTEISGIDPNKETEESDSSSQEENGVEEKPDPPKPDGPVDGYRWRHNGVILNDIFPPSAWRLVNYLFKADDQTATFSDMADQVLCDSNKELDRTNCRNYRTAANKYFSENSIPLQVSLKANKAILHNI
ncbi:hypothetical protein [Bythopirellula polymerisocia]|uniref:Uncharacterized protein n=1 Tax=Bythopirellula polymerisocia TaxID=2528003 RepID=A0A5C6CMH7_9BACT|nr:hypothetical protein [Bythopirellula polymerisocia]TWU24777.1 hypothetical protein Pla144_36630 [Bythopirellula polymerisocia]